jgi:hypothetical protein
MSASDPRLWAAFEATAYEVATPEGPFVLRVGQRHPEFDAWLRTLRATTWAFITAWNPGSRLPAEKENAARQSDLEAQLTALGYRFFPGRGVGNDQAWPPETSVLVVDIPFAMARRLGRDHGQLAIVVGGVEQCAQLLACDEPDGIS